MSDEHKDYDGIRYNGQTRVPLVFRILLSALIVWGICFMGYFLFSGWSSEGEFARKKQAKLQRLAAQPSASQAVPAGGAKEISAQESLAMGKKEYAERCAACHGQDAKGGIGPDLTRKEYKYGKTSQAIALTIAEGRPGGMPSFKNDLSRDKVEGLVKYILSL